MNELPTTHPRRPIGRVDVDGVGLRHPHAVSDALSEVSFQVGPGRVVRLAGPDGSGRSTLLALLAGRIRPTTGTIRLDGIKLTDWSGDRRAAAIAVVTPTVIPTTGPVTDAIAGGRPLPMARIVTAAKAADAHRFISALPDGYRTVVGEHGRRLAPEQLLRIDIARAIAADPAVVLLDDPTAGLGPEPRAAVLRALRRLMVGRSVVLVTDDERLTGTVDETLVLAGGRIVRRLSHRSLPGAAGRYAARGAPFPAAA